ncbi:MAG: ABC transporter permease subunit [Kiritimatiellia bacterium]|jgi:microcin C transport system permease protein|nr:ABC transporter permease subunit [Kiritimatiellia bacterium]MDP6630758.1 ABC transporter permease subunit [Kiritimatiellia bacterium]MDP6809379.1 ABC transporter permease subunit [Kiritimatiellia bacterium]MDP7023944.1 ABC transporter permease subunit [Kiritimatiellia bacterium]
MSLSPEFLDRVRKFKKNRRAYNSLRILTVLFLLTLPAELLFNNRPIVMRVDGQWFFPVFCDYTYKDLGGDDEIPVVSYKAEMFDDFIAGRKAEPVTALIFGDGSGRADGAKPESGVTTAVPRKFWALWPPIPHSYKSFYSSKQLERQRLASPFSREEGGVRLPGARVERHLLGTDSYGKDVLARLVYGFRLSLLFGLALAITSTVIGCVLGAIQGFFGGLVDLLGQRLTEIWGAIPRLLLLMILSDFLSRRGESTELGHLLMLFVIMNLTSWMGMAAHMRAQFLAARNLDYVKAAKSLGVSSVRVMFRHILPNSLTPIVTFLPFSISSSILALVGLDFLGFGIRYPAPSLGELLSQGQEHLDAWWIMVPTFLTLTSLMVLLTFVGDGVRNAFDPRYK